jgi:hypothetical protein
VEALADAARVASLTLVNVVDNRTGRDVGAVAAAMAVAYPRVWALGHQAGNTIVAGSRFAHRPKLARVASLATADRSPALITPPERMVRIIKAHAPLHDPA